MQKTWLIIFFLLLFVMRDKIHAQAMYGTTGLLHAPTAEMQRDKTVMAGGNVLHINTLHYSAATRRNIRSIIT